MDQNQANLLKDIMAVDFTLIDLHLYLDTHPCDQKALAIYNNCLQRSKMLRDTYERLYTPLNATASFSRFPWQWIENPWPWDREANP